jgi:hypothetical protein
MTASLADNPNIFVSILACMMRSLETLRDCHLNGASLTDHTLIPKTMLTLAERLFRLASPIPDYNRPPHLHFNLPLRSLRRPNLHNHTSYLIQQPLLNYNPLNVPLQDEELPRPSSRSDRSYYLDSLLGNPRHRRKTPCSSGPPATTIRLRPRFPSPTSCGTEFGCHSALPAMAEHAYE